MVDKIYILARIYCRDYRFVLTALLGSILFFNYAQAENIIKDANIKQDTILITSNVNVYVPDTLSIEDVHSVEKNSILSEKNMPWVIALLIGMLSAGINFWVANRLRSSNERNINRQVESAENNLKRQLENSEKATLTQFKSTIATKNRQDWINDLRHSTSELVSESIQVAYEMATNKGGNRESIKKHLSVLFYNKSKIEMLLNDKKTEQKELIDCVSLILSECIKAGDKDFNATELEKTAEKTILAARKLFGIHWVKIKELQ